MKEVAYTGHTKAVACIWQVGDSHVRGSLEVMKQPPLTDQRRRHMLIILACGRQRQDHEFLASLSYVERLRKIFQTDSFILGCYWLLLTFGLVDYSEMMCLLQIF